MKISPANMRALSATLLLLFWNTQTLTARAAADEQGSAMRPAARRGTYLVATADGVFALEGGAAHILVAGIGGELRIAEYTFSDAYLADARRHAAVRLRMPVTRP